MQTSADYRRQLRLLSKQRNPRNDSAYVFDAAWVIALALNASLANNMTYEKLLDRSFPDVFTIRDGIQQVDFQGLTVRTASSSYSLMYLVVSNLLTFSS
mgnify:FL=1